MNKVYDNLNNLIELVLHHEYEKKSDKEYKDYCKYLEMSAYENDLINQKITLIAGVDEAGRGPLAGPVVAGAVILPYDYYLPGLNDSKKLSAKKREYFYEEIIKNAISYSVGIATVEEIDAYNIYNSTKIAMKKAIAGLKYRPMHLLIDAMKLDVDISQTSIIKGDAKSVSIAAASVIAKVTRDRHMEKLHEMYPVYNFKSNSGYGTKEHLEAISKYGIIKEHRKSFEPIKTIVLEQNNLFNLA